MKITFIGAAHEVTGSMHLISACGKNILVDCGMEQGGDEYENRPLPVAASAVDAVLLTHAHIDHSGMLPYLCAQGFKGKIITTRASRDLCAIMLRDSANIQESEAEWKNRKALRAGDQPVKPLYTVEDAERALTHFVGVGYGEELKLFEGIRVRFCDVGHLLGSASVELWINEGGREEKLAFSGDIGNLDQPIVRDPQYLTAAGTAVMEATYGDRDHDAPEDYASALASVISRTFARGGNVVIPAFAVGRTQEILYFIRKIKAKGLLDRFGDFEVWLDSPLAVEATGIFTRNDIDCFDDEAAELVRKGVNPISFPGLRFSVTSDESKQINFNTAPKVIISASGMCEAGRIRHHLKHNLWRPECSVVFVGYQAQGTLGRLLTDGVKKVKLFGETIDVRSEIVKLDGISGHADRAGLLKWIEAFSPKPRRVYVVHADSAVADAFAGELRGLGYDAVAPYTGDSFDIASGDQLERGNSTPLVKSAAERVSPAYDRLLDAGKKLMELISRSRGGTNKDLARLTDQIESVISKNNR